MVYRAWDRALRETVAIKVLRPDVARESRRVEKRFRSEIRLARRVRHRNVCSVYGDGEHQGLRYICMELIEGENLARLARSDEGLSKEDAWDAVLQVADGLEAIHEAGVVHRDLKTANLMRDQDRVVRVMDFGIAKHHIGDGHGHTVTASGALMGTPEYMSPEQLRGEPTDFRSDLYSFGIVIYELFTGTLPFRGDTPVATILHQLQDAPRLELPRLPPVLRPLLRRALAKKPGSRFRTAKAMGDALRSARAAPALLVGGLGALARGEWELPEETRPLGPSPARERAPVARIALGLLGVIALAAHLLNAGGVAGATPALPRAEPVGSGDIVLAVPSSAPPPPTPRARRVARALPMATPPSVLPNPSPPPEPAVAEPVIVYAPSRPEVSLEPHRVYEVDEVDIPPRRIQGMIAPYPDWGPDLSPGHRVSITASFVVTEEGDVTDIRVEQGGGALEAGLVEISSWKYLPGLKDGVPVKVRVHWKHTFIGS